jgi:hypothetical protein
MGWNKTGQPRFFSFGLSNGDILSNRIHMGLFVEYIKDVEHF